MHTRNTGSLIERRKFAKAAIKRAWEARNARHTREYYVAHYGDAAESLYEELYGPGSWVAHSK